MTRKHFRRHFRIKLWLALAVAVASLGLASSAQAMRVNEGGGAANVKAPVVVTTGGFDWGDAAIGAGVALAAALTGAGLVQLARNRNRGRLAAQL